MNYYHIRIDGEQSTESYTFQELVDMGLFELDSINSNGIEVKQTTETTFIPLKSFCFPEKQDSSYYVDEYGQIHRTSSTQSKSRKKGYVDEYGQIIRTNNPNSSPHNNSNTNTTNPSVSSSSSNGDGVLGKIIVTIVVLAIGLPIAIGTINSDGGGVFFTIVCIVGYLILKSIWGWDD